ncbi:MAG: hypothetical protein ACI353_04030 [Alloprevotella sp.]
MKYFEFSRFSKLVKHDLLEQKRAFLYRLAGFYVAFCALSFCVFYRASMYGFPTEYAEMAIGKMMDDNASAMVAALLCMAFLGICFSFSHLQTKQQRIAQLMLPATNAEKFLSRIVIFSVVWTMGVGVALCLADVTRMVLMPLLGHSYGSLLPYVWDHLTELFSVHIRLGRMAGSCPVNGWLTIVAILLSSLAQYTFLLLGSTFFRRRALLYTLLVQIGFMLVLGFVVGETDWSFLPVVTLTPQEALWLSCIFLALLSTVYVALAYWLFCRIQVISRKWW